MAERMTPPAGIGREHKWKLEVVYKPIAELKAWKLNPRDNDKASEKLVELLNEYGIVNPIIITPDGTIRAGHTRVRAAVAAGFTTIPTITVPFESERKAVGFALADNKSSEWAKWDVEKLQAIFAAEVKITGGSSLQEAAKSSGFKASEIEGILAIADFSRADMVPQMPAAAISRKGEVYKLGHHRLMCGDSSSVVDVDRLLAGAKIHLVNTDPPYNVKVEPRSNNAIRAGLSSSFAANNMMSQHNAKGGLSSVASAMRMPGNTRNKQIKDLHAPVRGSVQNFSMGMMQILGSGQRPMNQIGDTLRAKDRRLLNDFVSDANFEAMLLQWFGNMSRVLIPGGSFYIWGGYTNWKNYCFALEKSGLYFSQGITWIKDHPVIGRKDFMGDCEYAWYGWKEGARHRWFGPSNARNTWEVGDPAESWRVKRVFSGDMVHITEKPVELATRAMQYSSQAGENVLDLFGGSGSTLIGCEQLNRNAYLMELDTLYCDVIRQRWSDFVYGKDSKWQSLTPSVK